MIVIVNKDKTLIECWERGDTKKVHYSYWSNFVMALAKQNRDKDDSIVTYSQIDYALKPYGARLRTPKTYPYYLRFNDEKQATMFMLRWA